MTLPMFGQLGRENKHFREAYLNSQLQLIYSINQNISLQAQNKSLVTQIAEERKATLDLDSLKAENVKIKTQIAQERKARLDLTEETISILSLFSGSQIKTMKALDQRKTLLDALDTNYKIILENIMRAQNQCQVSV